MPIIFYDYLVDKQDILIQIEQLEAPDHHKGKLRQLVDDVIHQGLIEYILQKLHPHQHNTFLERLHSAPYDPELISYLKEHASPEIEEELQQEALRLLKAIRKDLES